MKGRHAARPRLRLGAGARPWRRAAQCLAQSLRDRSASRAGSRPAAPFPRIIAVRRARSPGPVACAICRNSSSSMAVSPRPPAAPIPSRTLKKAKLASSSGLRAERPPRRPAAASAQPSRGTRPRRKYPWRPLSCWRCRTVPCGPLRRASRAADRRHRRRGASASRARPPATCGVAADVPAPSKSTTSFAEARPRHVRRIGGDGRRHLPSGP